ncbi:MAG: hypothetical protein LBR11_11910 [Deltaproteobacteria bacterium]|jgi:hypothetical protein|nr:hypothetical protein [Deltaproteobacteria bacterium]
MAINVLNIFSNKNVYGANSLFKGKLAGEENIASKSTILDQIFEKHFKTDEKTSEIDLINDKPKIISNFSEEIYHRLLAAKSDDPASAESLTNSLVALTSEVAETLGQDKANELMSDLLVYTDRVVTEENLSLALSSFFQKAINEEKKSLNIADNIYKLSSKLQHLNDFINQGLDVYALNNGQAVASLSSDLTLGVSYRLNQYFDIKPEDYTGPAVWPEENSQDFQKHLLVKGFDENFDRADLLINIKKNGEVSSSSAPKFITIYTGFNVKPSQVKVDEEIKSGIVNFLIDNVKSENAARYLAENQDSDFLGSVATVFGILTEESGQEAARAFETYLNSEVAATVNLEGNPARLAGWHLGEDWSNPQREKAQTLPQTPKKLVVVSDDSDLARIGRQGLAVNWLDPISGVQSSNERIDIDQLYLDYLTSGQKAPQPPAALSNLGNLVDTQV